MTSSFGFTTSSFFGVGVFSFSKAQEARFKAAVLEQVDLGHVPAGDRVMKLTLLELQPGAEIPPHTHKGPGLRYVLDGAISIAWKVQGGFNLF